MTATAEEAWSWEEFVAICRKLTIDRNGYDATNPNFNAEHITTYAVAFPQSMLFALPFIYSNGGQVASDDGQKLLLNQPAAVEALQQIQDLIYRYHVAPTPSTLQSMPSASFMLQTGKVAMEISGHWQTLGLSQMGFDWGMGVLPYFKQPTTIICGSSLGIFTSSKHPEEAFQLFKALGDTASNDLFGNGLGKPMHSKSWIKQLKGVKNCCKVAYLRNSLTFSKPTLM
ncbi:TPA: extracellular solute-binding protein [Candidatus Poribacteria bacterium]|nr:extracellular solute-binding protein [Candidatus Poribacteria bacterium]